MTEAELRAELQATGVDVNAYLSQFTTTMRRGFQQRQRNAALKSAASSIADPGRLFGDLAGQSFAYLKALYGKVRDGEFGPSLQAAAQARCRNQNGEDISTSSGQ